MAELTEVRTDGGRDADDRGRVGGPGAGDRRRARARPRRAPERLRRPRAQGARRLRRAALRGRSTSARTRSSSTSASGAPTATWRTIVDRAEVTRLGEGLDDTGRLGARADRADGRRRSPAMADEARRGGRRGDRRRRHRRAAHRAQRAPSSSTRCETRCGVEIEVISGEEEAPARLPRRARPALGLGRRLARRLRHRRRQLAVHVRPRRATSTSASACNVGAVRLHRALRARPAPSPTRRSRRRSTRSPPSSTRLDGRPAPDALVGMGGAVTNLAAVKHGLADVRPRRRPGHRARPRRDRPADRALPHPHRRRAARDRRPAAEPRRGHPRRRLHRAHGARRSSAATR